MIKLSHHRVALSLISARHIGSGTPALVILNAFLKSIKLEPVAGVGKVCQAFRVPGHYAHRLKKKQGEIFTLEVDFFGASDGWINNWLDALQQHVMHNPQAGFAISAEPIVSAINFDFSSLAENCSHAELEFLSPLPFKRDKGESRTQLSAKVFFAQLARRAEQLFGIKLPPPDTSGIRLQSNHWHYTELRHASKSQPGHTQYYNGCFGSLYFSGDLMPVLPWLKLAAGIHAGGSVELNPLGYCRLHLPSRPLLDGQLDDAAQWKAALLRVLDAHDDWEQHLAAEHGAPLDTEGYCNDLMHSVQRAEWQPAPAQTFSIPKRNGMRRIEKLPPAETLIHTLLHELLSEPIDRTLEVSAVGFRRGHSVQTTIARVRELLDQGYRYIVESDIEDFFPGINLDRVEALLDGVIPPADTHARQLLKKLLRASYLEGGQLKPRLCGLAQGSPLSPLLANLYLDRFDEAFNELDAKLVRYADDFVILARTRESAQSLLDLARSELEEVGLEMAEAKTAIHSVEEGFHFLGQPFGGAAENIAAQMLLPPAKKTIYITEPGCFLGHNGDVLEIRQSGKLMDTIPLRRVADIAVLAPSSFSSGLVQKCAKLGIPLTMTLGDGYHIASLPPDSRKHHGIAAAQAIHYARLTATERLVLAKGFASAKIANYKPLINARHGKGNAAIVQTLDACIAGIELAPDINSVRGHEGRAAKLMFATLDSYLKVPEFNFNKRRRENPDRMNVLLNFGYYLLFSRLNTMVRAAGLNPYLGFLHDGEDDYETLVCDIEELFRAAIDRHLIALVNLRIIKPDDFSPKDNGLRLAPLAIKRFLEHFEQLLHSDAGGITLLEAMQAQVRAFMRHVTEDQPLWYFNYQHAINPKLAQTEKAHGEATEEAGEEESAPWEDASFEPEPGQP